MAQKLNNLDFQELVANLEARRKHVRYSFQELALLLAKGLNDMSHRSIYFKLAKYENRELLMSAYMSIVEKTLDNKGALFMWKLKQLKENREYRAFVGLFLTEQGLDKTQSLLSLDIIKQLKATKKLISSKRLHITLNFISKLPADLYMPTNIMIDKFLDQYEKNEFEFSVSKIQMFFSEKNNTGYVTLQGFSREIYAFYKKWCEFVTSYTKKKSGNAKKLAKYIYCQKRFFPHITLARLKPDEYQKLAKMYPESIKISEKFQFFLALAISDLTKTRAVYKIHNINKN